MQHLPVLHVQVHAKEISKRFSREVSDVWGRDDLVKGLKKHVFCKKKRKKFVE
jgi:hypothetical protein